jgi:hypothetical protein
MKRAWMARLRGERNEILVRLGRAALGLPGQAVLRRLAPGWPAPRSRPIPARPEWGLKDYVAWRIRNDRDTRLIEYENKLFVKHLAERLGVPHVPVLACLDPVSLDVDRHPALRTDQFVLKMNHGHSDTVVVERIGEGRLRLTGESLAGDFPTAVANERMRRHFVWWSRHTHTPREWAVSMVWPRVLFAEPRLPLNDDYKVLVVRGRAELIMTSTGWESGRRWGGYFDRQWRCLGGDDTVGEHYATLDRVLAHFPRPANLGTLIEYAERMSPKDMCFIRMDFFMLADGGFMVGEAGGYSGGGGDHAMPEIERAMGEILWHALRV